MTAVGLEEILPNNGLTIVDVPVLLLAKAPNGEAADETSLSVVCAGFLEASAAKPSPEDDEDPKMGTDPPVPNTGDGVCIELSFEAHVSAFSLSKDTGTFEESGE
jgi:hypothetical protein